MVLNKFRKWSASRHMSIKVGEIPKYWQCCAKTCPVCTRVQCRDYITFSVLFMNLSNIVRPSAAEPSLRNRKETFFVHAG